MDSALILQRLYRTPPTRRQRLRRLIARTKGLLFIWRHEFFMWVREHSARIVFFTLVGSSWFALHAHYYNLLIALDSNVIAARAQIAVAEQKRGHLARDLTRLVQYYAGYERELMKQLTAMRATKPEENPASLEQLLARLQAVGEAYPNLTLTKTVEQLSLTITQVESEIAKAIMAYNDAVNVYSTELGKFPANVLGRPLGFRDHAYYVPPDPSAVEYKELAP